MRCCSIYARYTIGAPPFHPPVVTGQMAKGLVSSFLGHKRFWVMLLAPAVPKTVHFRKHTAIRTPRFVCTASSSAPSSTDPHFHPVCSFFSSSRAVLPDHRYPPSIEHTLHLLHALICTMWTNALS